MNSADTTVGEHDVYVHVCTGATRSGQYSDETAPSYLSLRCTACEIAKQRTAHPRAEEREGHK